MREKFNSSYSNFFNSMLCVFVKVEPTGFMQIRGKEVKPTYKSTPAKPTKPRMPVRPEEDKKLIKK